MYQITSRQHYIGRAQKQNNWFCQQSNTSPGKLEFKSLPSKRKVVTEHPCTSFTPGQCNLHGQTGKWDALHCGAQQIE